MLQRSNRIGQFCSVKQGQPKFRWMYRGSKRHTTERASPVVYRPPIFSRDSTCDFFYPLRSGCTPRDPELPI